MPVSPELAEDLAAAVADLYEAAEGVLIGRIRQALAQGIDSPVWAELKLAAVGNLQAAIDEVIEALRLDASGAVHQALAEAYDRGQQAAIAELGALGVGQTAAAAAALPTAPVVDRLAQAVIADTGPVHLRMLRQSMDVYRDVIARAAAAPVLGAQTRRQAAQAAFDDFAARGVRGFVDRAGRSWELRTYAEMAMRSATARAAVEAHSDRLGAAGVELVIVSQAPEECEKCRPWERKILSRAGGPGRRDVQVEHALEDGVMVTVEVAGSLDEARSAGLMHPNAILGNQTCRPLGEIENAARAWYEGPSVHLTTARGHRLTVSPNHPVLTTSGWLPAERISEGMHVLSRPLVEGDQGAADAAEEFYDAPASFEEVFDALLTHGRRTSVAASAHDFHGDGRSYKGEVSVVWAEGALLDVLQPFSVQQGSELVLVRPGVELQTLAGPGSLLPCGHRVSGPVARALADYDAAFLEAPSQRRLADAEDVGEILAGLACGVSADKVVHVNRDWFEGHCFDLQTSTGAYLTDGIVVHNCRHTVSAYLPGVSRVPKVQPSRGTYEDTQRQRYYERQVRKWKRLEGAAMDEATAKARRARVRAYQARIRELVAETGLPRKRHREQIETAR